MGTQEAAQQDPQ